MTHTVTPVYETRDGERHIVFADLAVSSLGSATGEAITPNLNFTDGGLGMTNVLLVTNGPLTSNGRYSPVYDHSTGKMRYFLPGQSGGVISESLPDVYGGIFAAITADAAAAALNDALVLALTDATDTAAGGLAHADGLTAGITNPNALDAEVVSRNIVVAQNANGAGTTWAALSALEVTGTYADGTAFVLDVPLQTTAIADLKFRLAVGDKAIATITKLRLIRTDTRASRAGPASSRISVGIGTIFGLRGSITAEGDIKSVRKDAAAIAAGTYVATAAPSQIDMGADVADGVDIVVGYVAAVTEAAAGTNVGTVRIRVEGT